MVWKALADGRYRAFQLNNPEVDLLTFDFIAPGSVSKLDWSGFELEIERARAELMTTQRVHRLASDPDTASRMLAAGLTSAHAVAQRPEAEFVARHADALGLDAQDARALHRRAVDIKVRTRLLWAALHSTVGSPHFHRSRISNTDQSVADYLFEMPSYQDFFGSLDYCSCEHCASIFGPAAYLVDMLRVVETYLANPVYNPDIPDAFKLDKRRPDISQIELTCANTNDVLPYLQVVNEVLVRAINAWQPSADMFRTLAAEPFPFVMPFNLPLTQVRSYLKTMGQPLWKVYLSLLETPFSIPGALPSVEEVALEVLALSPQQSAVVTTPLSTAEALGRMYGIEDGRLLTFQASGSASAAAGAAVVSGTGTSFQTELRIGDDLLLGAQRRVVKSIESQTALTVVDAFVAAANGSLTVFPVDDLSITVNFTTQTGLAYAQLTQLLGEHLDAAERAAGLADGLFVNSGNPPGQPLQIVIDRADPANAISLIANQNLHSLDRLNRFIRLAAVSGLAYADLDWAIRIVTPGEIGPDTLRTLGQLTLMSRRYGAGIDEIAGLYSDMKTIGVGSTARPLDLFDRVYNSPGLLGVQPGIEPPYVARGTVAIAQNSAEVAGTGTDLAAQLQPGMRVRIDGQLRIVATVTPATQTFTVSEAFTVPSASGRPMIVYPGVGVGDDALPVYHPTYPGNPLYTDPVLDWHVDSNLDTRPETRGRLVAALNVGDDDLTRIGLQALTALGIENGILPLTVPNLSLLYSYARMASLVGLPVRSYLELLDLRGTARVSDLPTAMAVAEDADWLRRSGLDPFALQYALQGQASDRFDRSVATARVAVFLQSVWAMAGNWLIGQTSFVSERIDAEASARYLALLTAAGFVNANGVVMRAPTMFADIAFVQPLHPTSFITPIIDPVQSSAAYDALVANGILDAAGVLSATFDAATDLEFLFPGDPNRDAMIPEVRGILLGVRNTIEDLRRVLNTYGGVGGPNDADRALQYTNLCEQLALFFNSSTDVVCALSEYIAGEVGPADFVAAFLSPPQPPSPTWPPQDILTFMSATSRTLVLVEQLKLSAPDIIGIVANPAPYGVTSFRNPTLAEVQSLWRFKELTRAYPDANASWLRYFAMTPAPPCNSDPQMQLLATITGWNLNQLCSLASTMFATGGFNTVAGVSRMHAVFALGAAIGADIASLLKFAHLSQMPAAIDDASWAEYADTAATALGTLRAKYTDEEWPAAYRPVLDTLNQAKRDALVPYAVHILGRHVAGIDDVDSLYNYLLIDVEMTGCADISYIAQAILSVQLYMQRARMMLEPGIRQDPIPAAWWTWLGSYRTWEANRRVFLYPENYLSPSLRSDKTPLYKDAEQALLGNDITPQTVEDVYVQYFEGFSQLSGLRQVAAYYGPAPDPKVPGGSSNTLYVVGRNAEEPYAYYLQSRTDTGLWSAWEKVGTDIGAPTVSISFAMNRVFLFWVERNTTAVSQISGGDANNAYDSRATLKCTSRAYNGRWQVPQTLGGVVADFDPMQGGYSTPQVNPNTFVLTQIQWNKISPVMVPSPAPGQIALVLNYGHYYPLNNATAPMAPSRSAIPNQDAWTLAWTMFESSIRAVAGNNAGMTAWTYLNPAYVLDTNFNVSSAWVMAPDVSMVSGPEPYLPIIPRVVMAANSVPKLQMVQFGNYPLLDYLGQGGPADLIGVTPLPLLYHITDRSGLTAPVSNQPLWFVFGNGDESFLVRSLEAGVKQYSDILKLKQDMSGSPNELDLMTVHYTATPEAWGSFKWSFDRLSTAATPRMMSALFAGGVDGLLSVQTQLTPAESNYSFSRFYETPGGAAPPNTSPPPILKGDAIDYAGPYGTYFYEIYLFLPWLVAEQLRTHQRFDEAKRWLQYIFDPTISANADPSAQTPLDRFWRFVQFRHQSINSLLDDLSDPAQIQAYNNDPFDPNAIARLRPSAYQKAIVMRYIDVLLEWGDFEFTKDTWESINAATLLYTLARDLLGPRPVNVGACSSQPPMTFADILAQYGDDIPQFLIGLENAVPHSGHADVDTTGISDRYVPYNDLNTYFCVPENTVLIADWDRIDDRLFKIRNCMNIQGVVRPLSLFAPPLDVNALVRGAIGSAAPRVSGQPQASPPPYRFRSVLAMARDLTGQLQQLGSLLLSALEKKDGEDLALLRQGQETRILDLTLRIRQLQIEEIGQNIAALNVSLEAAKARSTYYATLIDVGLSPTERMNIAATILAGAFGTSAGVLRALAALGHLVPNVGSPFAMTYGGIQLGTAIDSSASVADALSTFSQTVANVSFTVSGFERRAEDWQQQLTQADYEVETITLQISAAKLQQQMAQQELAVQLKSIQQSRDVEAFLVDKFTNRELYQWMIGRLGSVYFQAYRIALEMSVAAELAYQYELNSADRFITFEYWDSMRKGLLAGEQLMLSLSQMEKSYIFGNSRSYEIEKTISLASLDPKAVFDLQATGRCEFRFDETLFDLDFAGHYARQIKTVSVTIPALVGPYQNIHATLTQLGAQTLVAPDKNGVAFLMGLKSDTPSAEVLRSQWRANQRIALSRGVDDSGMFEMNFGDERYLPFEGTGAVSRWRLEMPMDSNLIDYATISDIVVRLRYTALDGGAKFAQDVRGLLAQQTLYGHRAFNLGLNYPNAWFSFLHPAAGAQSNVFSIVIDRATLPPNLDIGKLTSIAARLQLAPGKQLDGALTVAVTAGNGATTLVFDRVLDAAATGLDMADWVGTPFRLEASKANIPIGIRDPNTDLIAADAVVSIGLILTFEAKRR